MGLMAFIATLALFSIFRRQDNSLPESLPAESVKLAQQVADKLEKTTIPSYSLTYGTDGLYILKLLSMTNLSAAPIVVLDRKETYFPSDLTLHLQNTQPKFNFTPISNVPSPLTLSNLDELNSFEEGDVYLSSTIPAATLPQWLQGQMPSLTTLQIEKAINCVIVVVEKPPVATEPNSEEQSVTDVFYLYFYSFNDGPRGLGHQVGNHIGDWFVTFIYPLFYIYFSCLFIITTEKACLLRPIIYHIVLLYISLMLSYMILGNII